MKGKFGKFFWLGVTLTIGIFTAFIGIVPPSLDSHFVFFLICSCHLEKLGYYDHADSEAEEVTVRAVYHDVIMFQRNMVLCPEISEYFKDPL